MAAGAPPPGQRGSLQPPRPGPTPSPPTRNPLGKAPLAPGWPPAPHPPHSSPQPALPPPPSVLTGAMAVPPRRSRRKEVRPGTPRLYSRGGDVSAARGARREAPALPGRWRLRDGNPMWNFHTLSGGRGRGRTPPSSSRTNRNRSSPALGSGYESPWRPHRAPVTVTSTISPQH